ncbi:hypothetical protein QFC20_007091 [Naganishia adeliensis]|uniref:Uncharacterized protein n=1 Tax=Naganishia adeliensis TaxID=92952 RepID=A0ACC2V4V4_9TREE|nr:hypothetical protein QFC20_007091 [Naganishia adeliensis]
MRMIRNTKVPPSRSIKTTKKGSLLTAVTAFGEPEVRPKVASSHRKTYHPEDHAEGLFKLRLRYALKDYLQAEGLVPLDINIKPGEAGLKENRPIALEDDDQPRAGPSTSRTAGAGTVEAVKVKADETRPGEDEDALIARRIAEAQAELEASQQRQRMSLAARQPRPRPDNEEDDKENIMRGMPDGMNKKLKVAKEVDNRIVDLTFDDD